MFLLFFCLLFVCVFVCCVGRLAPIYSHSNRKVNFFEFIVYHRRGGIVGDDIDASRLSKSSSRNSGVGIGEGDNGTSIDLVGIPYVVQIEPFRSCEHLYRHIIEQSARFANTEELRSFLEITLQEYFQLYHDAIATSSGLTAAAGREISQSMNSVRWPYEALPFTVRLASVVNVACAGIQTTLASKRVVGGQLLPTPGFTNQAIRLGREHVCWEGSLFPPDRNRPVCNLFHSKLCIIVDWKPLYRSSTSGSIRSMSDSRFSHQEFDEDESYTNFVQTQVAANKSSNLNKIKDRGVDLQECLR